MYADELLERLSDLNERIENFFDGEDDPDYGDIGYQDLLQQLNEIEEAIEYLDQNE